MAVQAGGQRRQFLFGGAGAQAFPQASPEADAGALHGEIGKQAAAADKVGLLSDGRPEGRLADTRTDAGEIAGGDTDDGRRLAVDAQRSAQQGRIGAEMALPESITQDDHGLGGGGLIPQGVEHSSETRCAAEFDEEIRGDETGIDRLRFAFHRNAGTVHRDDGGEGPRVGAKEGGLRIGDGKRVLVDATPVEAQQRIGLAHVDGPPDHEIEEAKDGYVEPDADGEHEEGRRREGRRLAEHSHGVAKVLAEAVDPGPAPRIASRFAEVERVAEGHVALAARHFAMKFEVLGEFLVEAATVQQITQATE